jgi:hypothetical protein
MGKHTNTGSSVPSSTFRLTTMNTTAEFQPEIFPLNSSEEEIESSLSDDETTSTDVNLNYSKTSVSEHFLNSSVGVHYREILL